MKEILKIFLLVLFFIISSVLSGQNYHQKIFASDAQSGVFFGRFVSIEENYAFVSAYRDFENGSASGSLYIFEKLNGKFVQSQKLFPDDGGVEEYFGYSLSSFGEWVITGAHHDSDFGASSGKAYILHLDNGKWDFFQTLVPNDLSEADEFGKTVDIYGDFAVSCSYLDDDNATNSGSVYIYKKENDSWNFFQKLQADVPIDHSQFGLALDIYKDKLIVGAPYSKQDEISCGAIYIFEFSGNKWTQTAHFSPSNPALNDEYGITVKIDDNYAFASSPKDDDAGKNSGSVYVYRKEDNKWKMHQKLIAPDGTAGDSFGNAMETDGNYLYVASYFDDDNGTNSGSVYIFENIAGNWNYKTKFSPSDGDESDAFGASISIFDDTMLIGAYANDDYGFFAGAAYIFSKTNLLTKNDNTVLIENNVLIEPVVFNNSIRIVNKQKENFKFKVFNLSGEILFEGKNISHSLILQTTTLPTGIYFVKIKTKKIENVYKVIKI